MPVKKTYKATKRKRRNSLTTSTTTPISRILSPSQTVSYGGYTFNVPAGFHIETLQGNQAIISNGIESELISPAVSPSVSPAAAPVAAAVLNPTPVTMNADTVPASQPLTTPVMTITPVATTTPAPVTNPVVRNDQSIEQTIAADNAAAAPSTTLPTATQANNNIILYIVLALVAIYIVIYLLVGAKKS